MARRQCSRLTADEWAARLDACMRMVLRDPASFPPATLVWARWRRTWLTESGSRLHEPAERAQDIANQGGIPLEKLRPLRRRPAAPSARAAAGFAIWAPPAGGAGKT